MKYHLNNLVKWSPGKGALTASIIGTIIIILSFSMRIFENPYILIFIRDVLMVVVIGIYIPLYIIDKTGKYQEFGLHVKRWLLFLFINLILGVLILIMFLNESPLPSDFRFTSQIQWQIFYIMLTGVFEMIVFYSFIRTMMEKSFGIIPAILITSVFYSLHHAGFQPDFEKLIFVGILYATVFRLGNSVLLIYPFFWGVGACYDVLIKSETVMEIIYPEWRSIILLAGIGLVTGFLMHKNTRKKKAGTINRKD